MLFRSQSTCVVCEKDYEVSESTASTVFNCETGFVSVDNKNLYCSEECQAIDNEWLTEGNKIIESAKQNNPNAFLRTNMNHEQEQAMNTIKQLGVRFKGSELTEPESEN